MIGKWYLYGFLDFVVADLWRNNFQNTLGKSEILVTHTHRAVSTVTCSGLYPEKVLFLKFRNIPWEGVVFSSSGIYPEMFRNIPWERVSSVQKYTLRRCFPSSGLYPENVFTLFRNIPWEGVSPVQEYTLSRGFPYSGLYPKKVIPQFRNIPWAGVFLIQEYTLHVNVLFPQIRNIPREGVVSQFE